ncbi:hypothetical protein R0L47_05600 [Pectobacterium polonicum]|uniref:hypothetical protein n=1 Tax=Pectobacterium polonicum TaxID=2485124 RepID=UPI003754C428
MSMIWTPVTESLPKPLTRVWVMTDSGKQTTAYIRKDGEWFLFCRKIAAEKPEIVGWRE